MEPKVFAKRAFTLVELMVVIAVIMVLLSLLIVGLNVATRASQTASTRALMQAMVQGIVQFKEDVGYYPPVLDATRGLLNPPGLFDPGDPAGQDLAQEWFSITSLGEYLVGYGPGLADGYGYPALGEIPPAGIRNPGFDGVWGATSVSSSGRFADRSPPLPDARTGVSGGRVLGPYLQVDNERLLASLDPDGVTVRFPGDSGYREPEDDGTYAKVICDYWGQPIQYVRQQYPPGALGQSYRAGVNNYDGDNEINARDLPTLSDVFRLRPYEIEPGAETKARFPDRHPVFANDLTSFDLEAAEFALFSAGPNKGYTASSRNDEFVRELNKDNIVELGP